MQAIWYSGYGGPEILRFGERPDPVPGDGEVLVELAAAGVAPLDWKLRAGMLQASFTPAFPKIPGRDGVGTVLATGGQVGDFAPGDRVAVMAPAAEAAGTHASRIAVAARLVVRLPDDVTFREGAALVNSGLSAWITVQTAEVMTGDRVLIHAGAGAVGGLMVQLCTQLGAEVTATCRAANLDYVKELGASHAIAYDGGSLDGLPPQDVVFDLVGGEVHAASYPLLRKGGHLVWLSAAPIVDRGEAFGVRVTRAIVTDTQAPVVAILNLAAHGAIRGQVAGVLPLAEGAEAQRRLAAGEITRGRLLLEP